MKDLVECSNHADVSAGLTAAIIFCHLQKRVGDKDDAYYREHMVREMQALFDRRVVLLL